MTDVRERSYEELTGAECWDLVCSHVVGRLGVAGDDGEAPIIIPVNYIVDNGAIIFRSAPGTKLSLLRNHTVAFEVDHLDVTSATGWSVLLRGRAHELTHWESDHLAIGTWAPGDRDHFIRIVPETITGRRIVQASWVDGNGYL